MSTIEIIVFCLCIFIFSLIFTRYLIFFAKSKNIVDIPNDRSSHAVCTPRGGGLSISLSIIMCLLFIILSSDKVPAYLLSFTICTTLILIIGVIDDLKGLSIITRAFLYLIISFVFILSTTGIGSFSHHNFVIFILVTIVLTWIINLYNFMDGADAISGIQAVICALPAGIIFSLSDEHDIALLCYTLVASSIGFLVWNWPPAKIFMGDVGSCVIGFVFGCLMIITYLQNHFSILIWLILLSFFIVDSTLTLITRIINREKWYQAHRTHSYQRVLQMGHSHKKLATVFIFFAILIQWPATYIAYKIPEMQIFITTVIYIFLSYVWYVIQRKYKQTIL